MLGQSEVVEKTLTAFGSVMIRNSFFECSMAIVEAAQKNDAATRIFRGFGVGRSGREQTLIEGFSRKKIGQIMAGLKVILESERRAS